MKTVLAIAAAAAVAAGALVLGVHVASEPRAGYCAAFYEGASFDYARRDAFNNVQGPYPTLAKLHAATATLRADPHYCEGHRLVRPLTQQERAQYEAMGL